MTKPRVFFVVVLCFFVGTTSATPDNYKCVSIELNSLNDVSTVHPGYPDPDHAHKISQYVDQDVQQTPGAITFWPGQENALSFTFEGLVASGRSGEVYHGVCGDGTSASIKISSPDTVEGLRAEAFRMAQLSGHRGFPHLIAHGSMYGRIDVGVLAFEYFPRGDLQSFMEKQFQLSMSGAYNSLDELVRTNPPFQHPLKIDARRRHHHILKIAADAFTNLNTLHRLGYRHGAIKSQNILLDADDGFVMRDVGGQVTTRNFFSERRMRMHAPTETDDMFAMLLALLMLDGMLTPTMIYERSPLPSQPPSGVLSRLSSGFQRRSQRNLEVASIRKWDHLFRNHVLAKAAQEDANYVVWLNLWDVLKSEPFNSQRHPLREFFFSTPSPHHQLMGLLRDAVA